MLVGYARVSTTDQNMDLQRNAMTDLGVDKIFEEHVSGVKSVRPQLIDCLSFMREGDTLVVWKLDRLGRSLAELIKIIGELDQRGIKFQSITDAIDTNTPVGKFTFHILGACAQFERDLISERTKAGLKAARAKGRRGGRPRKLKTEQIRRAIELKKDPTITHAMVCERLGVSSSALYAGIKEHNDRRKQKGLDKALDALEDAA